MCSSTIAPGRMFIGLRIGRQTSPDPNFRSQHEIYGAVSRLADSCEYEIEQRNGQRYFGPPIGSTIPTPDKTCEVFIGSIPRSVYEDTLIPLLMTAGKLYVFRLMMDFRGLNRGFGFALFESQEDAKQACRMLNNYEVIPGRCIACTPCADNNCLYLGGVRNKSPEEMAAIIFNRTPSAVQVSVTFPDIGSKRYAVIKFKTHREAALARRYYLVSNYELWRNRCQVIVDWKNRHQVPIPLATTVGSYYLLGTSCYSNSIHNVIAYTGIIGGLIASIILLTTYIQGDRNKLFENLLMGFYGVINLMAVYVFYITRNKCDCTSKYLNPSTALAISSLVAGITMVGYVIQQNCELSKSGSGDRPASIRGGSGHDGGAGKGAVIFTDSGKDAGKDADKGAGNEAASTAGPETASTGAPNENASGAGYGGGSAADATSN